MTVPRGPCSTDAYSSDTISSTACHVARQTTAHLLRDTMRFLRSACALQRSNSRELVHVTLGKLIYATLERVLCTDTHTQITSTQYSAKPYSIPTPERIHRQIYATSNTSALDTESVDNASLNLFKTPRAKICSDFAQIKAPNSLYRDSKLHGEGPDIPLTEELADAWCPSGETIGFTARCNSDRYLGAEFDYAIGRNGKEVSRIG